LKTGFLRIFFWTFTEVKRTMHIDGIFFIKGKLKTYLLS